jgi:hypothetical protein
MFNNIPQGRLLIYIILAGLLPIAIAWLIRSSELQSINSLEAFGSQIEQRAYSREKKQAINMSIQNHFRDADHFYIDKHLETLSFLEPEIESLKKMSDNPNFPPDENVKKRLELLTGNGNALVFTEGVVQATPFFQEVTETVVHPVEVNVNDLRQILCRIEGVSIGGCVPPLNRPQLIILDFKIEKKNLSEKNQVFQLNLKLLKREFL